MALTIAILAMFCLIAAALPWLLMYRYDAASAPQARKVIARAPQDTGASGPTPSVLPAWAGSAVQVTIVGVLAFVALAHVVPSLTRDTLRTHDSLVSERHAHFARAREVSDALALQQLAVERAKVSERLKALERARQEITTMTASRDTKRMGLGVGPTKEEAALLKEQLAIARAIIDHQQSQLELLQKDVANIKISKTDADRDKFFRQLVSSSSAIKQYEWTSRDVKSLEFLSPK